MQETDPWVLDDTLWEELIELTDGAAAPCFQCGVCTATCPWGLVKEEPLSVRKMMRLAQIGILDGQDSLWLCTTCSQCEAYCPRGVPVADVLLGMRYLAWERRQAKEGLPSLLWSVHWNNNPWFQPPSHRSLWAKDLELEPFNPETHEILLYVGCTSSFDRRAQNVARSLVALLKKAGVAFGVLGDDEPCCGEAALSVGHAPYFRELAEKASQIFKDRGVGTLVTISPHCYDVFLNHYPRPDANFEPIHYTQYLARLLADGRLTMEEIPDLRVTFHDPCYLGRKNDEYEAPRSVLAAIPGVEAVEMVQTGVDSLCCGGGGGRMWMETAAGERFSDLRVQQAVDVDADVLVTACPSCIACLEDSLKAMGIENVRVLDVAEVAAEAITEDAERIEAT